MLTTFSTHRSLVMAVLEVAVKKTWQQLAHMFQNNAQVLQQTPQKQNVE